MNRDTTSIPNGKQVVCIVGEGFPPEAAGVAHERALVGVLEPGVKEK